MSRAPAYGHWACHLEDCGNSTLKQCTLIQCVICEKREVTLKNITLSADEHAIAAARQKARQNKTTLNAEFRQWLGRYAETDEIGERRAQDYRRLMEDLAGVSTGGKRFSRDELNER